MTTRHVRAILKKPGDSESDTGTLCKELYDLVNGSTVIAMSITRYGTNVLCVVVYDTT
jgi:hypothetical protein